MSSSEEKAHTLGSDQYFRREGVRGEHYNDVKGLLFWEILNYTEFRLNTTPNILYLLLFRVSCKISEP